MEKQNKKCRIDIRVTPADKSRIKMLAKIYAGGNVSKLIVAATLEFQRRNIK